MFKNVPTHKLNNMVFIYCTLVLLLVFDDVETELKSISLSQV